jgi:hypothetical protein
MMVETLIIAFYVIVVDLVLKAYWPEMSTNLGPYVGLIITNCIVMGRCEACGTINPPGPAFLDGLFNALGYTFVLLIIATIRELLGMGTFLGYPMPYFSGPYWDKWIIMVAPPGAFFTLAVSDRLDYERRRRTNERRTGNLTGIRSMHLGGVHAEYSAHLFPRSVSLPRRLARGQDGCGAWSGGRLRTDLDVHAQLAGI